MSRSPVRGNGISEHKTPVTSQQLQFRGVNVFLAMEPKCTDNYSLQDSVNLRHTALKPQQNSRWFPYNLCANSTRQPSPVCITGSYYTICQKNGHLGALSHLLTQSKYSPFISEFSLSELQHHFSIFCKRPFFSRLKLPIFLKIILLHFSV